MIGRRTVRLPIIVGTLGAALAGCTTEAGGGRLAGCDPAPAYAAATLDGDTVSLADFHGEVVLLNVWATWCPLCREEMPGLQALHEEFADAGLRVIAVSVDARSAKAQIRAFVEDYGMSFLVLHDPEERITRTFQAIGVPETFLIDRERRIAMRWIGQFDPTSGEARDEVRRALGLAGAGAA